MTPRPPARLWPGRLIRDRLRDEPPDVQRRVLDALDILCEQPEKPNNVMVRALRGPAAIDGARVALLPDGWRLAFRVQHGLPPAQMDVDVVVVLAFVKLVT